MQCVCVCVCSLVFAQVLVAHALQVLCVAVVGAAQVDAVMTLSSCDGFLPITTRLIKLIQQVEPPAGTIQSLGFILHTHKIMHTTHSVCV